MTTGVLLEIGTKRTFARAVDWPGWCRSGRTENDALTALDTYRARYAKVLGGRGIRFPVRHTFEVVERVPGSGATDFGAPGAVGAIDERPLTARDAARLATILEASWQTFDEVVAHAPAELRTGPRGGGRDRDAVAAHVAEAELAYARALGVKGKPLGPVRPAVLGVVRSAPGADPERRWPLRYGAARIAWHVLDHAWEIQDRST